MDKLKKVLEKQLEIEKANATERLTAANLDSIYKITGTLWNIERMSGGGGDTDRVEIAESIVKRYSNGRYDHNIDSLYDSYIAAKQAYKQVGDQGHRDKLMESVGRLMVEVYDMLSSMVLDSDFQEERKEVMQQIRKLAEM